LEYYLVDGHNSVRLTVSYSGGNWSINNQLDYTAFGGFTSTISLTAPIFLFGGDAVYDPVSGTYMRGDGIRDGNAGSSDYLQMDNIAETPGDLINSDLYVYCGGNPINFNDPDGHRPYSIRPVDMGRLVSNFIGLKFKAYDDYDDDPPDYLKRFSNQAISTIIRSISPNKPVEYNRPRPDLVQLNSSISQGDVYEIKAGILATLSDDNLYKRAAALAASDVRYYIGLLSNYSTAYSFVAGSTYLANQIGPSETEFKDFPFNPPGYVLVAFNNYPKVPGAILWDFVKDTQPIDDVYSEAAFGVAGGAVIAGAIAAQQRAQFIANSAPGLDDADISTGEGVAETNESVGVG
jgi:RHS repeat-associated protein